MAPGAAAASGDGADWVRVDDLLERASAQLQVGEMVQCETFSLFEAMSAVELGNAKMDAGASSQHLDGPEELIGKGVAPLTLSPTQQLAVMERLLVLEASHYCFGTPLAATVYSSVYMMLGGSRLAGTMPLLAAFCEGLQQSCAAVRWLVFNGSVCEEEDFNLLVTGLPCEALATGAAPPPGSAALASLAAAVQSAQEQATSLQGEDAAAHHAIASRLTLRLELHSALVELQHKTAASLAVCDGHCAAALAALASCAASAVPQEQLVSAPGFVEGLNRHLLGPAPPRTITLPSHAEAVTALTAMLQQLQQATHVAQASGFREVRQFIERFSSARACVVARSALHLLVAGKAWVASTAPPSGPHPPAPPPSGERAANGNGQQQQGPSSPSPPWALERPLLCEALALPTSPSLGEEVDLFLDQAAIAVGNWAQAMLLNPCRQRRRLRRGLEDWANLYHHAVNADLSAGFGAWMAKAGWRWADGQAGPPHPQTGEPDMQGPLATWVVVGMCDLQLLHLLLGWELELYAASEYCLVYWYIQHLLGVKRTSLRLLHQVQAPADGKLPMQLPAKSPGKGGKKRPPVPAPVSPATVRRQAGLMMDMICVEMVNHVCMGLTRLALALERTGLVQAPPLVFNTFRERFDQRFGSFHAPNIVQPEPLSLETFEASVKTDGVTVTTLLFLASEAFTVYRREHNLLKQQVAAGSATVAEGLSRDQMGLLAALDKVAATNSLACSLLAKGLEAADGGTPAMHVTFDFALHPFWPTLKIKSAAASATPSPARA